MSKIIKLTKGAVSIVDDEDYEKIGHLKWYCSSLGYAVRNSTKGDKKGVVRMHRVIMGDINGKEVDHINGDKLDNRKENLRFCSHRENIRNRGVLKNNTSGVTGVCFFKKKNLWRAHITFNGKSISLGKFANKEDAVESRKYAEEMYFKEFRRV